MKKNIYLFAGMLIAAIMFGACDNTDTEPSDVPETTKVELIAQYENSLTNNVEVEATWVDASGRVRHAYPAPHHLNHGNRQYSRITIDDEYPVLPASTEVTLTYKAKEGVIEEDGFVDIPLEGIDVIVYTGAVVTKEYKSNKEFRTTYDITSFIQQNVLQEEFLDMLDYLNTNCNKICVYADAEGNITTNATAQEAPNEEQVKQ